MKAIQDMGMRAITIVTAVLFFETHNAKAQDLDTEARAEVQKHFDKFWIQRDDSWVGIVNEGFMGGNAVIQAKGITFDVRSRPGSEADKLNGVDWSGDVEVYARVARRRGFGSGDSWGEWEKGNPKGVFLYFCSKVEKKNGKWTIETGRAQLRRPEPTQLP